MREIKFRGKRIDNGEWVYGSLIQCDITGKRYILPMGSDANESDKVGHEGCLMLFTFEVIPETVGQFTGLKDKNGKEIYEGDICNCREYECFGKVEWNNEEAGFYFCVVMEGGGFEEEHLYDYVDELEVIGNIYENPELLEVV